MQTELPEASAFSEDQLKQLLLKKFEINVEAARKRVTAVEEQEAGFRAQLEEIQSELAKIEPELANARRSVTKALRDFDGYQKFVSLSSTEPELEVEEQEAVAPETEAEPEDAEPEVVQAQPKRKVPAAKASNGKPGVRSESTKRPRTGLTVPERVAAVMGDGVWDAGALAQKLADMAEAGDQTFKSNSPRSYVSAILSQSMVRVFGADGAPLLKSDGKPFEVPRFISLERGRYRVTTPEEIQREARKHLGVSEVILSAHTNPVDQLFEEHGLEVPAAAQTGSLHLEKSSH